MIAYIELFIYLAIWTFIISFLLYIPFVICNKMKIKAFIKDFLLMNLVINFIYFLVFEILTRSRIVPINMIEWMDVLQPTFCILIIIIILKLILKRNIEKKNILVKLSIPFILWLSFFIIDFYGCSTNNIPIFSARFNKSIYYQDEGGRTVVYYGIGYQIYDFNRNDLKCKYICPWFTSYETAKEKALKRIKD